MNFNMLVSFKKAVMSTALLLVFTNPLFAKDFTWYFSNDGDDMDNICSQESPCSSLPKMNSLLSKMKNDTDTVKIYLKRGDIWYLNSSQGIDIDSSNVTIDAYGSGEKPILDGNMQLTKKHHFVITVGRGSNVNISNVHINNLRIQNTYRGNGLESGGGVIFEGTGASNFFIGNGSIRHCEFYNIGWSAISIYRVPNSIGPSNAVFVENNYIEKVCQYPEDAGFYYGPQAITTMDNYTFGHYCRYNKIVDSGNEGIGATGFLIVEYNVVGATDSPKIYCGTSNTSPGPPHDKTIIRYNLCWGHSKSKYKYRGAGIRVDDEDTSGKNNNVQVEIYGNIIIGTDEGIGIWNNAKGSLSNSPIGIVKIYNNTLIDCKKNFITKCSNRFNSVEIINNTSIVSSDSMGISDHYAIWSGNGDCDSDFSNWKIGPNLWYGDGFSSADDFPKAWQSADDVFLSYHPLNKIKGWRALSSLHDFSFFDFSYAVKSEISLIKKADNTVKPAYMKILTSGSNFQKLPYSTKFYHVDQKMGATHWVFGAIFPDFKKVLTKPLPTKLLIKSD